MKNAEGFIAQLNADLTVNHQEVAASPMLDLVEVRTQEWSRTMEEARTVTHVYYDRREAEKLALALVTAKLELEAAGPALAGEEASEKTPEPAARYIVVREVAGDRRVLDRATSCVLAARFDDSDMGLEDAERWARQLNESAAMAEAEKAARVAGVPRAA